MHLMIALPVYVYKIAYACSVSCLVLECYSVCEQFRLQEDVVFYMLIFNMANYVNACNKVRNIAWTSVNLNYDTSVLCGHLSSNKGCCIFNHLQLIATLIFHLDMLHGAQIHPHHTDVVVTVLCFNQSAKGLVYVREHRPVLRMLLPATLHDLIAAHKTNENVLCCIL